MKLITSILRKDLVRFRWQLPIPLFLLAWAARLDSLRDGATPGALEGALHLAVPLAWSFLIGALVREDSPVDETAEWKTLPLRWYQPLAAKLLFAAVAIHLPLLIAQSSVLSSRDLDPASHATRLLLYQVEWLLLLTLPSAALAAVTANASQFIACAVPIAVMLAWMESSLTFSSWKPASLAEILPSTAAIAAGSAAVLVWQYRRMLLPAGRAAGALTLIAALSFQIWRPREAVASLQQALSPSSEGEIRVAQGKDGSPLHHPLQPYGSGGVVSAIPVEVSGWPGVPAAAMPVSLEVSTPAGLRIYARWPTPWSNRASEFNGYLWQQEPGQAPRWLVLVSSPAVYRQLSEQPVDVRGSVLVDLRRPLPAVYVEDGRPTPVPGAGRCSSAILAAAIGRATLRTSCESADPGAISGRVVISRPGETRQWTAGLGSSWTPSPWPQGSWLSPVYRRDAFFHLDDGDARQPGQQYLVPARALPGARIRVELSETAGARHVHYHIQGIRLSDFTVPDAVPPWNQRSR